MNNEINSIETKKEISSQMIADIRNEDWYGLLKDDINSDLIETEFDVKYRTIELYHRIGRRIAKDNENFKRKNIYGKHIAEIIGEDINRHPSVIRRAVQFYEKAPDLQEFLSDKPKNLSWNKIKKDYLPGIKKKEAQEQNIKEIGEQQDTRSSLYIATDNNLNISSFTLDDILTLFLNIRYEIHSTKSQQVTVIFKELLKGRIKAVDIKALISTYTNGKTEKEISILNELVAESISTTSTETESESFFKQAKSRPTLAEMRTEQAAKLNNRSRLPELIEHYKKLYKEKYHSEPAISNKSYMIWGRHLKIKLEQGYTFDNIIAVLDVFAKSKDSEPTNLGFSLNTFFSDTIFNKMQALKNKNSNGVTEGKYAKF